MIRTAIDWYVARLGVVGSDAVGRGSFLFLFTFVRCFMVKAKSRVSELGEVSNGAEVAIALSMPYSVSFTLTGNADLLFHRWNVESVAAKAAAAKGSAAKKSDDVESYVYRNDKGELCIPGEYVRQALIMAAKYQQDPRSPRKSACDLCKAAIVSLSPLASLGVKDWDYLDQRRVTVQRNGITRTRPAVKAGWKAEFLFQVNLPNYIDESFLHALLNDAGKFVGVGDFRPTYGRFRVSAFGRV